MSKMFGRLVAPIFGAGVIFGFAMISPAAAENWVNVVPNGGLDGCLDKDSVRIGSDGLTYFTMKICGVGGKLNMVEAVQCSQDWSGANIAIRSRSMLHKDDGSWRWSDREIGTTTLLGATAKVACGK